MLKIIRKKPAIQRKKRFTIAKVSKSYQIMLYTNITVPIFTFL